MPSDIRDLRDTIVPKSDQLNADQLLGGPMNIRVTGVKRGSDDQPIIISYENDGGRPYKPCKSMRKVLIFAWGEDGSQWVGRMMTLYNKQDVKWGGVEVGGIRISHLSHVTADIKLSLAATRGKKEPIIIKRIDSNDPVVAAKAKLEAAARSGMDALKAAWGECAYKTQIGPNGCPENYKAMAVAADAERKKGQEDPLPDKIKDESPEPAPEPAPELAPASTADPNF